jgi:dimethylamine/trimethylamine dehydrogenase
VIVGARFSNDFLHGALTARADDLRRAGITSVRRIGDAAAPGAIVHAVYSGHRFARELDAAPHELLYRRDAPLDRRSEPAGRLAAADLEGP